MGDKKQVVLITGGTGTLGTALAFRLVEDGYKVRTLSRSEAGRGKLRNTIGKMRLYAENISINAGDICDVERLRMVMRGVDIVVHAAALKRIDDCERDPVETMRVNVGGTMNVIEAAVHATVRKALLISTDKACSPSTLYGASKLCAERMWLSANCYEPFFMGLRYGNVFGSNGSVLHAFADQKTCGQLKLTDPEATRFHITLDQAVDLIQTALRLGRPGELHIPSLPSYTLSDLATAYMAEHARDWKAPQVIGLRSAEKQHELLICKDESECVTASTDGRYVLEPARVVAGANRWEYSSGTNGHKLTVDQLRRLIREYAA